MGFTLVNELPTPAEILEQFPLADHLAAPQTTRMLYAIMPTAWLKSRRLPKTS